MATVRKCTTRPSGLERRQQIENMRAAALALIKARPQWITISGRRCPTYEGDGLRIIHYTPFQGLHLSQPSMPALAAGSSDQEKFRAATLFQRFKQPGSGLNIWSGGKKVLNIVWDGDGEIEVVSFKRGDWERKLA
ncbi:hypothetical protein GALL_554350 [mine drainage metagenome]|uniref:Uncharacterized protein n=1 Tax=mine drainage metagenome TaxID=410659 RepID=A0A1J5NWC6_9ZZZZ